MPHATSAVRVGCGGVTAAERIEPGFMHIVNVTCKDSRRGSSLTGILLRVRAMVRARAFSRSRTHMLSQRSLE